MKKIIALLLCLLMVVGMVACATNTDNNDQTDGSQDTTPATENSDSSDDTNGNDGDVVTITYSYWGTPDEAASVQAVADKFHEEYPNIKVEVMAIPNEEYVTKLNTMATAGELPDCGIMNESGVLDFASDGLLYDISAMYEGADSMPLDSITFKSEGKPVAYSAANEVLSLYYNKDMFDKAGITEIPDSLEGIGEIGQDLLDKGGAGEVMSLGIYGWFFEQFIGKQGLEYANNGNGRKEAATAVAFDENDAAKNILTAWKNLNDKGFAPVVGKGGDAGLADFSAGKSAITLGSTASLKQILQDVNGKFEVGTAYFPKIKSSDEGGVSIGGASLWALNNNDPKKLRATWEFVKFLISPESQAYWNAQTGYFPVTVKSQEEQVFKDNVAKYPQFQTAIDQLHDSSADYVGALLSVFPEARATVESEIESMLNGKEDVDTAVKNMADSINKSIEEYNLVNE